MRMNECVSRKYECIMISLTAQQCSRTGDLHTRTHSLVHRKRVLTRRRLVRYARVLQYSCLAGACIHLAREAVSRLAPAPSEARATSIRASAIQKTDTFRVYALAPKTNDIHNTRRLSRAVALQCRERAERRSRVADVRPGAQTEHMKHI